MWDTAFRYRARLKSSRRRRYRVVARSLKREYRRVPLVRFLRESGVRSTVRMHRLCVNEHVRGDERQIEGAREIRQPVGRK